MLADLNAAVVAALHAPDPPASLATSLGGLEPAERAALAEVDPDGLRVAALLVKKLRFERLLLGAPHLRATLHSDPRALVERFRRYDAAVPARHRWPKDEAAAFAAFEKS